MSILKTDLNPRALRHAIAMFMAVYACLSFFYFSPAAKAQDIFDSDEVFELILQVERKREGRPEVLAGAMLGFQKGLDTYYLPLKDLAQIVGFEINVDLENERAEGWFISPENTYVVDAAEKFYTVQGERFALAEGDVIVMDYGGGFGDIYVRYEMLNKIWPLELELDFLKLRAVIHTPRKLPYEIKREREARRERLLLMQQEGDFRGFEFVENDYRWLSAPVLDISGGYRFATAEEEPGSGYLNVLGKNDLLGFSADYNFSFDYNEGILNLPEEIRLTMTRTAYGEETMPLGLRNVRIGDVSARTPELVAGANGGRGFTVSSRPVNRKGTFDEVTIEGSALPGWEIELYNNGELLDFGVVGDGGLYRFDIDLLAGGNTIRVVLYGPHGEIEERVEYYRVSSLVPPGETEYEFAVVDTEQSFISFTDEMSGNRSANPGHGYAYSGSVSHGVNRWLSVFATGARAMTRQNGKTKYLTAGANVSLGLAQSEFEAYKEVGGGHALSARLSSSLLGWNLNMRTALTKDFESDRIGFDDDATVLRAQGRVSRRMSLGFAALGVNLNATYEKEKSEETRTNYQISSFISKVGRRLGNTLRLNYRNSELNTISGILNASYRVNRQFSVRSILNYDVKPHFQLSFLNAALTYRHSQNLRGGVDWGRSLITGNDRYSANISYDFGPFLGGLDANWSADNGATFGVRASTSLAPYAEDGSYIISSDRFGGKNAIRAALFLDENLNGAFDEGEMPVEGDRLLFNGRKSEDSNAYGLLSEIRSGDGDLLTVEFDRENATNPFFGMREEGYVMLLRPGVAQNLEVPIVETGLIDGTVYFENGRPVPGLRLELIRLSDGLKAGETITTFDGFYTFQYVKPGNTYVIQAAPSVEAAVTRQILTVMPDNLFNYGVNLELKEHRTVDVDVASVKNNYGAILSSLQKLQNTLSGAVNGS